jgi:glycosyltransferase involved in cell wall biosynthesis
MAELVQGLDGERERKGGVLRPKVSVCVISYNQLEYIDLCLTSIIAQKCDFEFEIIVGDDCSTDGTAAVVARYAKTYPEIVRAIVHAKNIGAKSNLYSVLANAKGEYVALCEGDDCWASSLKLQKQCELLDRDQSIALVHSNVFIARKVLGNWRRAPAAKKQMPVGDLTKYLWSGWFNVHTATILLRRNILDLYLRPEVFRRDLLSGDWPLVFCAAQIGRIAYIDECLAVYRQAPGSIMRSGDAQKIRLISERLLWWEVFLRNFPSGSITDADAAAIAQGAMLRLGYRKMSAVTPVHVKGVGYFKKSGRLEFIRVVKDVISTVSFFFRSKPSV